MNDGADGHASACAVGACGSSRRSPRPSGSGDPPTTRSWSSAAALLALSAIASSAAEDAEAATAVLHRLAPARARRALVARRRPRRGVGRRARGDRGGRPGSPGLVRDQLLAGAASPALVAVLAHRVVEDALAEPRRAPRAAALRSPTRPAGWRVAVAMIVTTAPHLSRPLRYAGRWVITLGTIGTVFTQDGHRRRHPRRAHPRRPWPPPRSTCSTGRPAGRPSLTEVTAAVRRPRRRRRRAPAGGAPAGGGVDGAGRGRGRRAARDQGVRARRLGLPAGDPGLALPLVPPLLGPAAAVARGARWSTRGCSCCSPARRSIAVPKVRAAGRSQVRRRPARDRAGRRAGCDRRARPPVDARWRRAHDAGVSPCSIDVDDLGWTADRRRGASASWASGTTAPGEVQRLQDRAQLLVATAVMQGQRRRRSTPPSPRSGDDGATDGRALPPGVVGAARDAPPGRRPRRHDRDLRNELSARLGHRAARARPAPAGHGRARSCRRRCWCWPAPR